MVGKSPQNFFNSDCHREISRRLNGKEKQASGHSCISQTLLRVDGKEVPIEVSFSKVTLEGASAVVLVVRHSSDQLGSLCQELLKEVVRISEREGSESNGDSGVPAT